MKTIIYIFIQCLAIFSLSAQEKTFHIDYKSYVLQYNADSLMGDGHYSKAIKFYNIALQSDNFFKYEIKLKMAYCYAVLHDDSLAKETLLKAYNDGFKYWYKGGEDNAWLLHSLEDDSSYSKKYYQLLKINNQSIYSDSLCSYPEILDSLNKSSDLDQKYRVLQKKNDSIWRLQEQIDNQNQKYVKKLLQKFNGLPSYLQVGRKGLSDILLITVHATDTSFLGKMIQYVEQGLKTNNGVQRSWYAILVDKYCIEKYDYQIFGTQVKTINKDGEVILEPLYFSVKPIITKLRSIFRLPTLKKYKSKFVTG